MSVAFGTILFYEILAQDPLMENDCTHNKNKSLMFRMKMIRKLHFVLLITVIPVTFCVLVYLMFSQGKQSLPQKTFNEIALFLPGNVNAAGWSRIVFSDIKASVDDTHIAKLYTLQNVDDGNLNKAVESIRRRGISTAILAFPRSSGKLEDMVKANQDLKFIGLFDTIKRYANFSAYVPNFTQGAYLAGYASAAISQKARIGLIVSYDTPLCNAIVNAFVLGAKEALPGVMVYVTRTGSSDREALAQAAADRLIDIWQVDSVASFLMNAGVSFRAVERGLPYVGFMEDPRTVDPSLMIAQVKVSTDQIFDDVAKAIERGRLLSGGRKIYDIASGTLGLENYSNRVPTVLIQVLKKLEQNLRNGAVVFKGPIKDTEGTIRADFNEVLLNEAFNVQTWYVDGTYVVP